MECLAARLRHWSFLKELFLIFENIKEFDDTHLDQISDALRIMPYLEKVTFLLKQTSVTVSSVQNLSMQLLQDKPRLAKIHINVSESKSQNLIPSEGHKGTGQEW